MAQDEHGACVRLGDDVDAVVGSVVDEEVELECVGQFAHESRSTRGAGSSKPYAVSQRWVCHCTVSPAVAGRCVQRKRSICSEPPLR